MTEIKILDISVGDNRVLIHFNIFVKDGFWDITDGLLNWFFRILGAEEADKAGWRYELLGWPYAYIARDGIIFIPIDIWNNLDKKRNQK